MKIWLFVPCFYPPRIEWIKNNVRLLCWELNDKIDIRIITHKPDMTYNYENSGLKICYLFLSHENIFKQIYYYLVWAIKSFKFCYKNKFDIINFHYLETSFLLPIIFISFLRVKFILTIYSFDEINIRYKRIILKLFKKRLSKIVIISESLRYPLISLWFDTKKIECIPIAFDKKKFLKNSNSKNRNLNNILFSAWINKKCWSFFMVDLAKKLPNFNFIFTLRKFNSKSENDLKELKKYIQEQWVRNIEILRNVDNMDIILEKIWGLVVPLQNINAKMAVPVALIEAMAKWTVCFVSDLPHLRFIINDKNVVFFEKENILDLKEKLNNIELYYEKDIWKNAYKFVQFYPDSLEIWNKYLNLFKSI